MTLSTIDKNTALIVIDLQKGILAMVGEVQRRAVLTQTRALLDTFRALNLPVVLVQVIGAAPGRVEQKRPHSPRAEDWDELAAELAVQPSDYRLSKERWGAFSNSKLHPYLQERGVTQIVLAGISTSIGVESSARSAYALGYHVTLAIDAMANTNAEAHDNSLRRIFPRLGETGSTAEIIALLQQSHA